MLNTIKPFILEVSRVVLIAVVSYLATDIVIANLVDLTIGARMDESLKLQITALLTVIVKAVDRSLHESGVNEKGLTRF